MPPFGIVVDHLIDEGDVLKPVLLVLSNFVRVRALVGAEQIQVENHDRSKGKGAPRVTSAYVFPLPTARAPFPRRAPRFSERGGFGGGRGGGRPWGPMKRDPNEIAAPGAKRISEDDPGGGPPLGRHATRPAAIPLYPLNTLTFSYNMFTSNLVLPFIH